jgi:hypothetical protein
MDGKTFVGVQQGFLEVVGQLAFVVVEVERVWALEVVLEV